MFPEQPPGGSVTHPLALTVHQRLRRNRPCLVSSSKRKTSDCCIEQQGMPGVSAQTMLDQLKRSCLGCRADHQQAPLLCLSPFVALSRNVDLHRLLLTHGSSHGLAQSASLPISASQSSSSRLPGSYPLRQQAVGCNRSRRSVLCQMAHQQQIFQR